MDVKIKIAVLIFFIYLFASPTFTSTIVLGQEVKASCDSVRADEAQKYPHIIYCGGEPLKDDGPGTNYAYFVYVSGVSGWNFNLKAKGILSGERPIKSDSYTIESFYTSENNKPVASFGSGVTDQILINHEGSFLIRGPKDNLRLEAQGLQANYVKTIPVDDCKQLVYAQVVSDAYQKIKFAENLTVSINNFDRILASMSNTMINSLKPNMFSDPRIYTNLMQLGNQNVEGMRLAFVKDGHEIIDSVLIPTTGDRYTSLIRFPDATSIIDDAIRRAQRDNLELVPIHNHPGGTTQEMEILIREGITYDELGIPSVDPTNTRYDWVVFRNLRNYIEARSLDLSDNGKIITIKYQGILSRPTEDSTPVLNFWEFGENPDANRLITIEGSVGIDGNPVVRPNSELSAGYWQRLWTKIDGQKKLYLYEIPPQPELYDLALPYEMDFFNTEIFNLDRDFTSIVSDVSVNGNKNFDDVSGNLNDLLKWIGQYRGYLFDSGLSQSSKLTWNGALDKLENTINIAIRDRLDKDSYEFRTALHDLSSYIIGAYRGQYRTTQDMFRNIEETLYANGITPSEDFSADVEKYASQSSNNAADMGRLFNSNAHNQRAGQVLDNYDPIPQELTNPLGTAIGKVAAIGGFIPGFMIAFGPGLATWAAKHNDYATYELAMSITNIGISITISIAIAYGLILVQQALLVGFGMAVTFVLQFVTITVLFFVIGLVIGIIAVILLFILFPPDHTECELDSPWYTTYQYKVDRQKNGQIMTYKYNKDGSPYTLHYVFYGMRYCPTFPAIGHTAVPFYTATPSDVYSGRLVGEPSNGWGYCTTLDGRCFDCSVNVTYPGLAPWYLGIQMFDVMRWYYPTSSTTYPEKLYVCNNKFNFDIDSTSPYGSVGLSDLVTLALAYDTKPGDRLWNPLGDVNNDGKVNLQDLVLLALNYGKSCP
jgi:uncharacterized Tic20 family protein